MLFRNVQRSLFFLVAACLTAQAGIAEEIVRRETLTSRTYQTWEGVYVFSEQIVVRIQGQADLHLFVYRCPEKQGALIAIANSSIDGLMRILFPAIQNHKGVTPIFEGLDALPNGDRAEILLRWRHPGEGGLRSIHKFIYTEKSFELVLRSDLVTQEGGKIWINSIDLEHSTQTTPAARSETGQ